LYIHPNWLKPVSIGSEVCARRKRESGISFFASFKAGGYGGWRRKWQDADSLSSPSANSFATFPNHTVCLSDSFRTFGAWRSGYMPRMVRVGGMSDAWQVLLSINK